MLQLSNVALTYLAMTSLREKWRNCVGKLFLSAPLVRLSSSKGVERCRSYKGSQWKGLERVMIAKKVPPWVG